MAYIDIIDSTGNNYRYALPADGSVLLIGSGEDCSISLPHIEGLLPRHCTVSLQAEGYVIAAAVEEATLLAESQPTAAAVLVPHAVYNIGSAVLMYDDAETSPAEEIPLAEEPLAEAAEEEAPVRKKKKKARRNSAGPLMNTPVFTEEEGVLHIILRRLYVIAIIALSFLAGLTFRYWMTTGEYLIDELLK
ncbi:MAG: hypothetical protein IKA23_03625 [Akkermansia sp.]|nr:hypothetical protein [Akkermansia sp.]MBR2314102.1 hypothetical protein [Akkermansia sp.]